jgi:hypothetical protein
MNRTNRRVFIIEIEIQEECWDYKVGQIFKTAIISNNKENAYYTFKEHHCGSEYPSYGIISIEDTIDSGFFAPRIKSHNLL